MIPQKEFYFLRHGQTDYNLNKVKEDHPADIPLNGNGRIQAASIEPIIANLPIKTVCCSPMRRALETKEIVTPRVTARHIEISDLGECTSLVWKEMPPLKEHTLTASKEPVLGFVTRVLNGISLALSHDGPVLVVAHGGVHWALCSIINIQSHEWSTDNCIPIHFFFENRQWHAKKLF